MYIYITIKEKETMILKDSRSWTWKSLEGGKGRGNYRITVYSQKIKNT